MVHDPLILHLTTTQQHTYTINQPHKPLSLNTLCVKHMAKQYGPPPSPADKKGADSGGTGQANPHQPCPPSHTQPFSHLHTTVPTNPQGEALWEAMEANIDTSDIAAATPATTRQQYPEEQRTEYLRAIHATMDQQFEAQATAMQQALDKKDLDAFMETWAQAFEDGVFAHVGADAAAIRKHRGHGQVHIQTKKVPMSGHVERSSNQASEQATTHHKFHTQAEQLSKQTSRLAAIRDHLHLLCQYFERQEAEHKAEQATKKHKPDHSGHPSTPPHQAGTSTGSRGSESVPATSLLETPPVMPGAGDIRRGVDGSATQLLETPPAVIGAVTSIPMQTGKANICRLNLSDHLPIPPSFAPTPATQHHQSNHTGAPPWVQTALTVLGYQVTAYVKHANTHNRAEQDTMITLSEGHTAWRKLYVQIIRHHKQHQEQLDRLRQQLNQRSKQATATKLSQPSSQPMINRLIKRQTCAPLQALQRPADPTTGGKPGAYTADPLEVDKIIRDAWHPIYNGNSANMQQLIDNFFNKYQQHIHQATPTSIQTLTWQDVKAACNQGNSSAPGMDAWTKHDLSWLSDLGYQWLTKCYNTIEATHQWPSAMAHARAVFLSKDTEDMGNPMAYRILKITSVLYRLWASIRIKHLEQWIATWADPAMFAGVAGAGAEEGWYLTQLDFELKQATGADITAASIDVYKCFDQIVRPLVVALARAAGMPPSILSTYEAFQEKLVVHNQIGPTLGQPHQHRCSIPQGCPFSMALVALLMKPWLSYMRAHRVEPRVLADDLFMYASRMKHASATMQGMNLSRQFFADVGAKVADNKCFITSTCATTRAKLRTITWAQTTSPTATATRCTDGKPQETEPATMLLETPPVLRVWTSLASMLPVKANS